MSEDDTYTNTLRMLTIQDELDRKRKLVAVIKKNGTYEIMKGDRSERI